MAPTDSHPQDVYAKSLPTRYGYPLWNPELNPNGLSDDYRRDGLQIGDVGIVDQDHGFRILFNICRPRDDVLHSKLGVPQSYPRDGSTCPIKLDDDDILVKRSAILPGTPIFSSSVERNPPPSGPSADTGYEFTTRSSEGTILVLPHGATLHDFQHKDKFRNLAIRNAADWYCFAAEKLPGGISNDSLYLITGFYKARSWSLAVFQNASPRGGRPIRATKVEDSSSFVKYEWNFGNLADCGYGPTRDYNGNEDQTVFLRGYKMALRDRLIWSRKPVVDATYLCDPPVPSCSSFLELLFNRGRKQNLLDLTHSPKLSQPFHYSDVINRYLLSQDPHASVAITHDSDWTDLLEKGELQPDDLLQEGCLVRFVSEKRGVEKRDCVVYLRVKSELRQKFYLFHHVCLACSANPGSGHELPGDSVSKTFEPSNSDPQIVIVGIQDDLISAHSGETSDLSANSSRIIITRIRGDHITVGPGQTATECYVSVEFDGIRQMTKSRPTVVGEATEWDDQILLPSDLSTIVCLSICGFVFGLTAEETLHELELSAEKLFDCSERGELINFPSKDGASSCPSLLIDMERKNVIDLDDSTRVSREKSFILARAAEEAGCWKDVVNHMKNIAFLDLEFTPGERSLFFVGYENLIAARRVLWNTALSAEREEESRGNASSLASVKHDRQKLEGEIVDVYEEALGILEEHLIRSDTSTESIVFYGQRVGDYNRSLSEFQVNSRRQKSIEKSLAAYEVSWSIAISELRAIHPTRLHLALNFSLFYYEVLHSSDHAVRVAQQALCDARAGFDELSEKERNDSMLAMQLLSDNVTRWTLDDDGNTLELKDKQDDKENSNIVGDVQSKINKECPPEVVKADRLNSLLHLLRSTCQPDILSSAACIHNLSTHPQNASLIIDSGFLQPLIHLLSFKDNEEVQCHAMATLRNLAAGSQKSRLAIVKAGAVQSIKELVLEVPMNIQSGMTACVAALALNDELKSQLLEAGICEVLVPLTNSPSSEVQANSATALGNLSFNDGTTDTTDYSLFNNVWDMPDGGMRRYLYKFLTSPEATFQYTAIWTIVQLLESGDPQLINNIRNSNLLNPAIRQLASSQTLTHSSSIGIPISHHSTPRSRADTEADMWQGEIRLLARHILSFVDGGIEGGLP